MSSDADKIKEEPLEHTDEDQERECLTDEENLISMEKLDRASPEMFPEKIPGVTEFISMNTPSIVTTPPAWTRGLSQEDINTIHQLGALSTNGLINEIRKLQDQVYQLGVQESKEMTRGKYLQIFSSAKKK